jgi:Flp pilus assembly protein TadG
MSLRVFSRLNDLAKRLSADQRGAVLIYVTLLLPVLIGFSLLAVDASRLYNLSTHLQKGADALALAGAAELDLKPDAITRADAAIANMVANQHKFSNAGTVNVAVASKRYLSALPSSDATGLASAAVTTDPVEARFVEVTVTTQTLTTLMPASFLGGSNTATSAARAVAGHNTVVCKFTPVYICNPYESASELFESANDPAKRRRLIELRRNHGGTAAQNSPGNYAFLDPPGSPNETSLRETLGKVNPGTCFVQNGVSVRPGFISSARQGLNVRFDLYEGNMNGAKSDQNYRPALNVRKGYKYKNLKNKNACDMEPGSPPDFMKFPRDNCFASNSCPYMGGRMGDGDWDLAGYWSSNFSGKPAPPAGSSRYEVYRYEIDNNLVGTQSLGGEIGTPACYSGGALSDDPDRRILYGAILDCGLIGNGNSGGAVPAIAFAKFFMTEPVGENSDHSIFVELIGLIEPGTVANDVARDIVQLYR